MQMTSFLLTKWSKGKILNIG